MGQAVQASAVRLLLNSFRTGLFENPYVEPAASAAVVGNPDFMQAGFEAQLKSVVMVKNHGNALPRKKAKVFVPERYFPQMPGMFGLSMGAPGHWDYPVDKALVEKYYDWAEEPEEADFALVVIEEPKAGSGYDVNDRKKGGNGYVPISLQYRPYKAEYARKESIAGGDPKEDFTNRSYKGKTVTTFNEKDLDLVILTKKQMGNKPVVVVVRATRPVVLSELEPYADAVLIAFGVQNQAVLDLVSGAAEPSGLLPMQFPADMRAVEEQKEDVPHDMRTLVDADGNAWDFAYGLNWSGVIDDARTAKYRK